MRKRQQETHIASVRLQGVGKHFGDTEVLHDIDLDIADGEFIVIVGPSGCRKSTLLRMIAGLEQTETDTLEVAGRCVNDLSPSKREIAMVFQNYALYPHMSVRDNLGFPLSMQHMDNTERDRRINQAAHFLGLEQYLDRWPQSLSGGQRQRVAIGRAMVREPQVFLFDEPLSNLDAALRVATPREIRKLNDSLPGATMIYVTHDQIEAITLADRIVVLSADGGIQQIGTSDELYLAPSNVYVARFIGSPAMNLLPARLDNSHDSTELSLAGHEPFSMCTCSAKRVNRSGI